MRQGSNMRRAYRGMRNGISLVEMLIAIVLFGIIGTISYTYYKNYYDVSFAAKQLRVYTIVDQAAQLGNAFDIYNTKNGTDALTVQDFVDDKILTQVPVAQPFVSATGWQLIEDANITGAADANGTAFIYKLDGDTLTPQDSLDYCNILNNVADKDSNLTKLITDQNASNVLYAAGLAKTKSEMEFFHCEDVNDGLGTFGGLRFVFVKRATKTP
jgi:prepilin-type N-terminal cleavage/methylation domain-containing protein